MKNFKIKEKQTYNLVNAHVQVYMWDNIQGVSKSLIIN